MLGKLLKYELKAMGRVMIPLYGVLLAISAVFAAMIKLSMSAGAQKLLDKFAIISGILFAVAVAAALVVMIVLTIQRYYKNLLGNEGYLMFTLPATTLDNILSKAISSMIWIVIGIIIGAASGFVIVAITSDLPEFLNELKNIWNMLVGKTDREVQLRIFLVILMTLVSIGETLAKVYAAISIGHQVSSHRLAGSVAAYIGIGVVELLVIYVSGAKRIMDKMTVEFTTNSQILFYTGVIFLLMLIYGAVAWYLLDRKLNLE